MRCLSSSERATEPVSHRRRSNDNVVGLLRMQIHEARIARANIYSRQQYRTHLHFVLSFIFSALKQRSLQTDSQRVSRWCCCWLRRKDLLWLKHTVTEPGWCQFQVVAWGTDKYERFTFNGCKMLNWVRWKPRAIVLKKCVCVKAWKVVNSISVMPSFLFKKKERKE